MEIIYDRYFNKNEWFIIITLTISLLILFKLKKKFPLEEALVYFFFSIFIGMVADHTIGIRPFDFYDVNDSSKYELFDFLTYFMYCPFGYFYIYFYHRLKVKTSYAPVYILISSLFSTLMEFLGINLGVFHYKNGYKIFYSLPIYLLILSLHLYLYKYLHEKNKVN